MDEQRLSQLMRLVAQNLDKSAFSELFDFLGPRIKSSLMRAGMDATAAEDVMQDVMINVWTKAGLFDPARGGVLGWVHTIARNVRIDRLRRAPPATPLNLVDWDPVDDSASSEETLVKTGEAQALRHALTGLSPEQRTIIDLAFAQELTQAQIATKLELPLGTVKSRLRLAYAHLKKCLEHSL